MNNNAEISARIKATAFITSSVLHHIAQVGCPDETTLDYIGQTLELELLDIANSMESDNEKNS